MTYPGENQLTGTICSVTQGKPGTITITVPTSLVQEPGAINNTLYSVTASTMSLVGPAEDPSGCDPLLTGCVKGFQFNLIDPVQPYDFTP
jgi:hypothetical protein